MRRCELQLMTDTLEALSDCTRSASNLVSATNMNPTRCYALLRRLEEAGLVAVEAFHSGRDRRVAPHYALTGSGRVALESARSMYRLLGVNP